MQETDDGGQTWGVRSAGSGVATQIRSVARVTHNRGLAVGFDGVDFWHWRQDSSSTAWNNTVFSVSDDRYLYGVALRSYNSGTNVADFWAAGYSYNPAGGPGTDREALVLRRNADFSSGTGWTDESPANVGSYDNYLYGVSTTSSSDVFVVGYYYDGTNNQTLIHSCAP